jgi:uncharacterized membrane protein
MNRRSRPLVVLLPATLITGLVAGWFGDWARAIMPGLRETDDRTFVAAFQALDRAILSPQFMLAFMGALVLIGLAALLYRRAGDRAPLPWVTLAFGLYLVVVVITLAIHEPLNQVLRYAGDPDAIADVSAVRNAFDEANWAAWHHVRTVATTAAFGCLAWALVLHGRATAHREDRRLAAPASDPPQGESLGEEASGT